MSNQTAERVCKCGCGLPVRNEWKQGHNPKNLGKHFSDEHKRRLSESNRGKQAGEKHPFWGKRRPEIAEKLRQANLGKTHSEETKRRISATKVRPDAKPDALHMWLNRWYPRTARCEQCGREGKTDYASINGHQYTRDRADYAELCPSCHLRLDYAAGARRPRGPRKPR